MDVVIKVEPMSVSEGDVPVASIDLLPEHKVPKTEPNEEYYADSTQPPDSYHVEVKCEYNYDPEHDDKLKGIKLEQQCQAKPEPIYLNIDEGGADRSRGRPAIEAASVQLAHSQKIFKIVKRYPCSVCHKYYRDPDTLKTHFRIHTGEKPFTCEICKRKFTQNSSYRRHKITHTGEKPYKCDVCQYRCNEKSNLQVHMRSHYGEKPYECTICRCRFTHSSHLTAHFKTDKHKDEELIRSSGSQVPISKLGTHQRKIILKTSMFPIASAVEILDALRMPGGQGMHLVKVSSSDTNLDEEQENQHQGRILQGKSMALVPLTAGMLIPNQQQLTRLRGQSMQLVRVSSSHVQDEK